MAREYENYMSTPLAYATPEQVQAAYMAALNEQTKSPAEGVPIKSWTQGVASMIDALAGTKRMGDIFGYQKEQQLAPNRLLFPGGAPGAPGAGTGKQTSAAAPQPGSPDIAQTQNTVAQELTKGGLPPHILNVVMHNAGQESAWNHRSSHIDQDPRKFADPNSYGLWQYGGSELKKIDAFMELTRPGKTRKDFLNDPQAQAQYLIADLTHNPENKELYARMSSASPEQANEMFVRNYLRPAKQFADHRTAQGYRAGIPDYAGKFSNVGSATDTPNVKIASTGQLPSGALPPVGAPGVVPAQIEPGAPTPPTAPPSVAAMAPPNAAMPAGSPSPSPAITGPQPTTAPPGGGIATPQTAAPEAAPQQMAQAPQAPQQGGQGPQQFYPPTQKPTFTDEQIYQATRRPNWQSNPALNSMVQTWMAQKMPTQMKTPDGTILYGNPFIGYRPSGMYDKPDVMSNTIKSGGSEIPVHTIPGRDAHGNPVQQQYPIVPAPGQQNTAPMGAPGQPGAPSPQTPGPQSAVEPFPFNGSPQDMIAWGQRNEVRQAGAKKGSEQQAESDVKYSDKVYQGLMGTSMIAAQQKVNLKLAKEIVDDPSFVSGFAQKFTLEQQRALARVGIDPGAAAPREVMEQLFARILADQFSGIRALAAESGEQGGRIFQSMLTVEEKAMPSADDTPAGIRAKINILDKVGDLMMQFAKEAAQYKKENGRLDSAFETHLHDLIAKAEIPWGAVKSSSGKTTEKPKTEPGSFKYDAQGKRIP